MLATYTLSGMLRIDSDDVATYDADGGEWVPEVDAMLGRLGYRRTGPWTEDPITHASKATIVEV